MRDNLSVDGELEEVEDPDVKWKLTFTVDRDTRRVLKVAVLPAPVENKRAKIVYEAGFGRR